VSLPLVDDSADEVSRFISAISAGHRHFLYPVADPRGGIVYIGSLGSGRSRSLIDSEFQGEYASGHVLFVRGVDCLFEH
jgi:hypothetical protein